METQSRFHQLLCALPDILGIDHKKRYLEQSVCESGLPALIMIVLETVYLLICYLLKPGYKIDVIYLSVSLLAVILFTAYMPILSE